MNILNKLRKPSLPIILLSIVFLYSCSEEGLSIKDEIKKTNLKEDVNKRNDHRHDVQFNSFKNNEFIAILDLDKDGNFKNYYFIQSDEKIDFNSLNNDLYQIDFNDTYLIFKSKKGDIIFSIDDENINMFKSKENKYFSVVGISKRYTGDSPLNINSPSLRRSGGLDCHSGGEGSSQCSTESGAPLSGNCSVSCKDTHYACCDDTRNECKCIPNGTKPNELTP